MNLLLIVLAWLFALPLASTLSATSQYGCAVGLDGYPTAGSTGVSNHSHGHQVRDYNAIGVRYRSAWPMTDEGQPGKLRVIDYCFATAEARVATWCNVQAAIKIWSDALGGPASPQTGHNLAFRERTHNGSPAFCYTQWDAAAERGHWNDDLPGDTLAIWAIAPDASGAWATIGYNSTELDKHGRHILAVPDRVTGDPRYFATVLAHELGHVFGMHHEHQRPDRDNHVEVRCEKQVGFEAAVQRLVHDGAPADQARQMLCQNVQVAKQYGVHTYQLIRGVNTDGANIIDFSVESPFDHNSIMMYYSWAFTENSEGCQRGEFDECVIVGITKVNGEVDEEFIIPPNAVPSHYDVAFVRKYYPWVGWGSGY